MTGFNHALTGAAIGLAVQQPLLIIPLAFVSHFVLDTIPHFDHPFYSFGHKHSFKLYTLDGVVAIAGLIVVMTLAPQLLLAIILGAAFAVLPDAILVHHYIGSNPGHWFHKFHKFHLGIQWFERPIGLFVELAYLVFISTTLFSLTS